MKAQRHDAVSAQLDLGFVRLAQDAGQGARLGPQGLASLPALPALDVTQVGLGHLASSNHQALATRSATSEAASNVAPRRMRSTMTETVPA